MKFYLKFFTVDEVMNLCFFDLAFYNVFLLQMFYHNTELVSELEENTSVSSCCLLMMLILIDIILSFCND